MSNRPRARNPAARGPRPGSSPRARAAAPRGPREGSTPRARGAAPRASPSAAAPEDSPKSAAPKAETAGKQTPKDAAKATPKKEVAKSAGKPLTPTTTADGSKAKDDSNICHALDHQIGSCPISANNLPACLPTCPLNCSSPMRRYASQAVLCTNYCPGNYKCVNSQKSCCYYCPLTSSYSYLQCPVMRHCRSHNNYLNCSLPNYCPNQRGIGYGCPYR